MNNNHKKDIQIPVPWGHISGYSYGDPNGQKVLMIHGWTDNLGTFDVLIPLLSKSLHIVVIDLPGHGLSSHYPQGFPYHQIEYVAAIRRVVRYLKWTKFDFVGHSLGGAIGTLYASIFTDEIEHLIVLDYLKMLTGDANDTLTEYGSKTKEFFALDRQVGRGNELLYPLKTLCELYVQVTHENIDFAQAKILMKRGAKRVEHDGIDKDKWTFTRDVRVRNGGVMKYSHEAMYNILSNLKHPKLLIVKAIQSEWPEPKTVCDNVIQVYEKNCKKYNYIEVNGNHFLPLSSPTSISDHINKFLTEN